MMTTRNRTCGPTWTRSWVSNMGESQKPTTVGITPSFLRKIDDHVDRFSYGTRNAFVLEAIRNQIRHDERHPSRAPLSTVREAIRVIMSSGGYFTAKFISSIKCSMVGGVYHEKSNILENGNECTMN
jgi:Arc/MetJ-type ribon-helix-helix transcriptional regulator